MRCHYMSDLHLEGQEFPWRLPKGDVLIVAGDLCHAACLAPARSDLYAQRQRDRVMRLADAARASHPHVLLIAGNHDHYDGILEDTAATFRAHLPGFTVLDDEATEIGGIRFFGTTLWSDFERGSAASLARARRGAGEFFFVKTRADAGESGTPVRFRPEHAAARHARALAALGASLETAGGARTVVISHHAPSLKGLNPVHAGNGLDGAYASDLDATIAPLEGVPIWVHGHTHIRRSYRIGATEVRANCRGFEKHGGAVRGFSVDTWFDL